MRRILYLALAVLAAGLLAPARPAWALTVEDVAQLLRSGVGERVVLEQIEAERARFRLDAEEILALKDAGASDDLLRAMIRTGAAADEAPARVTAGRGEPLGAEDYYDEPSGTLDAAYASPGLEVRLYYDPFGYHWYAWPSSFAYYYPFSWVDSGFYYAGWWDTRWWYRGSWCDYYRYAYCQPYWHGWNHHYPRERHDGRYAWNRQPDRRTDHRSYGSRATTPNRPDRPGTIRRGDDRPTRGDRPTYRNPSTGRSAYGRDPGASRRPEYRNPGRATAPAKPGSPRETTRPPSPNSRGADRPPSSGRDSSSGRGGWRR